MEFYPEFVAEGVYLRTETDELIGRLDGEPFATLEEAREKADWLEMTLKYQRSLHAALDDLVSSSSELREHKSEHGKTTCTAGV